MAVEHFSSKWPVAVEDFEDVGALAAAPYHRQFKDGGAYSPTIVVKNGFLDEVITELPPGEEAERGLKRNKSAPSIIHSPVVSPVVSPQWRAAADPTVEDIKGLDESAAGPALGEAESTAEGTSFGRRASGSFGRRASGSMAPAMQDGPSAGLLSALAPLQQRQVSPPGCQAAGYAVEFTMSGIDDFGGLDAHAGQQEKSRADSALLPHSQPQDPRAARAASPTQFMQPAAAQEGRAVPPFGAFPLAGARAVSPVQLGQQMVALQAVAMVSPPRPASPAEYTWQMSPNRARHGAVSPPQQMSRTSSPGSHQHGWQVTRRGSAGSCQASASRDASPQHPGGEASPPGSQQASPRQRLSLQELLQPPLGPQPTPAARTSAMSSPRGSQPHSPQESPRLTPLQSPSLMPTQSPTLGPHCIVQTTDSAGLHQVRWTIDADKLRSQQRQTVSPSFEIPNQEKASFRLVLCPRPSPDGKGGPCFKKACGWGSVQLKCEVSSVAQVTYTISLTSGRPDCARQARGPFTHDFAKQSTASLPKDQEQWDFTKAVDADMQTFTVCIEVALANGS